MVQLVEIGPDLVLSLLQDSPKSTGRMLVDSGGRQGSWLGVQVIDFISPTPRPVALSSPHLLPPNHAIANQPREGMA